MDDCDCIYKSRELEIAYETGRCPHQIARKEAAKEAETMSETYAPKSEEYLEAIARAEAAEAAYVEQFDKRDAAEARLREARDLLNACFPVLEAAILFEAASQDHLSESDYELNASLAEPAATVAVCGDEVLSKIRDFLRSTPAPTRGEDVAARERERCARIVSAARNGDIDQDWRTVLHFIDSGDMMLRDEDSGEYVSDYERKERAEAAEFAALTERRDG